jgi:hypothetical protein
MCATAAVVTWLSARIALGAGTEVWTVQSSDEFQNGTPKNVAISDLGELSLAPDISTLVETEEPYVWSLVRDGRGNVYAGTGNGGKVLRVDAAGKSSVLADTPEVAILSLALGPDGYLYAGTAPDGLIYRINPGEEMPTPTTVFREGEKYVWAMVFDDAGNLYAATGENGKLFKLSPKAENPGAFGAETLFDAEEAHLLCLALREGMLYAGSDGSGLIYRIRPDEKDKGFVLYDTDEKEVRALLLADNGALYAVSTTGQPPRPQPGGMPQPQQGGQGQPETVSYLYEVTREGIVRRFWKAPEAMVLSLALHGDRLLAGTGNEGKLYAVAPDGKASFLGKVSESQVLAILPKDDGFVLATGNGGKLYSLGGAVADEGTWESKPFDAKVAAQWGTIRWDAGIPEGTTATAATRSGNTSKPNRTWSEWSEGLSPADSAKIASPGARFLQVRLKLASPERNATPTVRKIEIAYLQQNVAPEVASLTVEVPKEEGGPRPPSGPARRPNSPQDKPATGPQRVARWQADDANGDTLEYALYYRAEGELQWHLLKDELTANSYTWDTTPMPDGDYRAKVTATDRQSNPPNRTLSAELIGEPFRVDNTQPVLAELSASREGEGIVRLRFTATDATSYLAEAAYSLDADKWRQLFPTDDLFDGKAETFDVLIAEVREGTHSVAVRVKDMAGNMTAGRARF